MILASTCQKHGWFQTNLSKLLRTCLCGGAGTRAVRGASLEITARQHKEKVQASLLAATPLMREAYGVDEQGSSPSLVLTTV